MTIVLQDLATKADKNSALDSQNPSHNLILPIETACEVSALSFSTCGRYLFAAIIIPSEKRVHLCAWEISNKQPYFFGEDSLPVESLLTQPRD